MFGVPVTIHATREKDAYGRIISTCDRCGLSWVNDDDVSHSHGCPGISIVQVNAAIEKAVAPLLERIDELERARAYDAEVAAADDF